MPLHRLIAKLPACACAGNLPLKRAHFAPPCYQLLRGLSQTSKHFSMDPCQAHGGVKWNRRYIRMRRRGMNGVLWKLQLIFCGFNLYKYHRKRRQAILAVWMKQIQFDTNDYN